MKFLAPHTGTDFKGLSGAFNQFLLDYAITGGGTPPDRQGGPQTSKPCRWIRVNKGPWVQYADAAAMGDHSGQEPTFWIDENIEQIIKEYFLFLDFEKQLG